MPLVQPLSPDHSLETKKLAEFFNETLGFCPNSVLTMQHRPAISNAFINLNKAVMATGHQRAQFLSMPRVMNSACIFMAFIRSYPCIELV